MKVLSKNIYIFLFTLLTAVLIVSAFISYKKIKEFDESVKGVIHSNDVKNTISEVLSTLKDAETSQRGYLLSHDSSFLQPYIEAQQKINSLIFVIDTLVADNVLQHNNFLIFKRLVLERLLHLKNNIVILSTPQTEEVKDSLLLKGQNKMNEVRTFAALILRQENSIFHKRLQAKNQYAAITPLYLLGFSLLSLLALTLLFSRLHKETNLRIFTQKINKVNAAAAKKIEESEFRFKLALRNTSQIVFTQDVNLKHTWIYNQLPNFDAATIIGKDDYELHEPKNAEALTVVKNQVLKTGKGIEKEVMLTINGETIFYNLLVEPIKNNEGRVEGISGVAINISENVIARKRIEESEQRIRLAVESGRLGTFEIDLSSKKIIFSERLAEIFGLNYSTTWSHQDLTDALYPDDVSIRDKAHDIALKTGTLLYEARIIWKDGSVHWIRTSGRVIKDNNVATRLYGTILDITEEKLAVNKLAAIKDQLELTLKMVPAAIQLHNSKGELLFVNNEAARITGFSSAEEMMREKDPDHIYQSILSNLEIYDENGRSVDFMSTPTAITFSTGLSAEAIFRTVDKQTGQSNWIISKSSALIDKEGKVSLVISTNTDITQQKKGEQELKRFKHMADNATEAFILMRQDASFAYLNDVALERWGYSREESNHLRVPDVDPIYNNEVYSRAFAVAQQEKIPQFETLHKKKDGTIYPVEVNMSVLILDGKPHLFAIARDITERKKMESAQKESQEKIRSFIVQAPVAMCLYRSQDYIIEIVNKELLTIWDRTYDAVIGKPIFQVLPEAKNQGLEDLLEKVFTTGEKFTAFGKPIMLKKNGKLQRIYVNLVYEAYRESDGNISGIVEVVSNVTEQVEAGEKVKVSEQRFAAAVQAVQGILWTNNAKGEMEGEQMGWAALTGQSYYEYQGYGWATPVHPDDAQPTVDAWNLAVTERKVFDFEHRLKMANGQWGYFSIRAIPLLNTDGSIREWVGVHTNITEKRIAEEALKDSEEKFRGLAETLPHLVWITNEKGEALYASSSWQEYSGFNPYEVGNWPAIVHPQDMEPMTNAWLKSLKTGTLYHAEARLKNKHGEYRWHVVEGVSLKNKEGEISKWIGAFTDINEQKLKEQKKDEFISIASHEMKTPLTTAKGYLELLLLTIGEEHPTSLLYAQKASNSIDRLHDLVAELLDASKIQNGKLNYNVSTFDFNEMLNETIENIQHGTNTHIITKSGQTLKNIKGDKNRLQQVLINLLSNAIKYSPNANNILVEVAEKENLLQVSVKDFGVGISKQHLGKIFERYYRVQEHALHFQGLGIGLYISYDIIKRHNGNMWAESEPGIGSVFYFTIPIYFQ